MTPLRIAPPLPARMDERFALRILGVRGAPEGALPELLRRAEETLRAAARPRAAAVWTPRHEAQRLLPGKDIARHLAGCELCAALACTLGPGVDAAQRAANVSDMAFAAVLDALASALAEQIADAAEEALRARLSADGLFLTGRFSPGYGDYPIELQNEWLRVLDAQRAIGLCATPTHLLTPRKSVTAVLGAAAHPVTGARAGCASCVLRGRCAYRKEGKTCETDV